MPNLPTPTPQIKKCNNTIELEEKNVSLALRWIHFKRHINFIVNLPMAAVTLNVVRIIKSGINFSFPI